MESAISFEATHVGVLVLGIVLGVVGWLVAARSTRQVRAGQAEVEAGRGFRLLVEESVDPTIIIDGIGTITYVNQAAKSLFGYGDERIGTSALDIIHDDERSRTVERIGLAAEGDSIGGTTLRRIRAADGTYVRCESVSTNLLDEPAVAGIVVVLRDVGARLDAEEAARAEHHLTETILDTTTALVITAGLDGTILSANRAVQELLGYPVDEIVGASYDRFVAPEELEAAAAALEDASGGRAPTQFPSSSERNWVGRDGRRHLVAWTRALLLDAHGDPRSILATGIDVTETRRVERAARLADKREHDRLSWDATHDPLTRLFNRAGLLHRLDRLLTDPDAEPLALLFTDLDGFKAVNDEHGHAVGDEVLEVVARRLGEAVRGDDVVGRLGGDEFVIICPRLTLELARNTAERVGMSVDAPIIVDGHLLAISTSTGVVVSDGATDAATLLEAADAAMYAEKRSRREVRSGAPLGDQGPEHPEERRRIKALHRLGLLDTEPDPYIDTIVAMAADVCGTPMAAVSLVDTDRQWLKASVGIGAADGPRSQAFCAHTILDAEDTLIVDDARLDDRFEANPAVTGEPHVRFYAGAPISLGGEPALGSLCVIDDRPRQLTRAQVATLERLRDSLVLYLELTDTEVHPLRPRLTG